MVFHQPPDAQTPNYRDGQGMWPNGKQAAGGTACVDRVGLGGTLGPGGRALKELQRNGRG